MPSRNDLLKAREIFIEMLKKNTKEHAWQMFFTKYPYVLSESLPLRLERKNIRPLGRPGKSEPDFIFYPTEDQFQTIYGVVEIKRPDTPILYKPRKNVLRLSGDAQTALAQAKQYAEELGRSIYDNRYQMLALGNELHAFLILGLSNELAQKVTSEILKKQYDKLLLPGFRLIPYDTLLKIFESRIPPQVYCIFPQIPISISSVPTIDYSKEGGYVKAIRADDLRFLKGVKHSQVNGKEVFEQKNIGYCLYCGEKEGFNSLSAFIHTPAGDFQKFEYGIDNNKPYRILRCNKLVDYNGTPLEFREIYEKKTLLYWLQSLKKNYCGRCGSKEIKFTKWDLLPVELHKRWECKECGLFEEYRSWGPPSAGA